uniref:Pentraxin family member n=1 Tax=Poecilia latipinna TaxID=48699 RepID=A0A3B3UMS2_9TELE
MPALLLFVMLTACAACLQGKTHTFYRSNMNCVLICLFCFFFFFLISDRSFTDLSRAHSLFSLATPSLHNGLLIFKETAADTIGLYVNNQGLISVLDYELNAWHSVCSTWDSESGLGQLWFDGKPSEQDSYGGKFDIKQSFVGMMTDVHMWDYVLSSCEIQNYVDNLNFSPGNVLNWKALTFEITGRVLIENKQLTCH